MRLLTLGLFIALIPPIAKAEPLIVGRASVIDGDTIAIRKKRIRLVNMDAPESAQLCFRKGKPWRCGQRASLALSDFIGRHVVTCSRTGSDRYRRVLGRCYADGIDLGGWMVRYGWAIAYIRYGREYLPRQRRAKKESKGIWSGAFVDPSKFRACMRRRNSLSQCSH